jgi:hypothetical protein
MEGAGMIMLEQLPGAGRKARKIVEAMLVTMPDNFKGPVAKLRLEKGIQFPPAKITLDEKVVGERLETQMAQDHARVEEIAERARQAVAQERMMQLHPSTVTLEDLLPLPGTLTEIQQATGIVGEAIQRIDSLEAQLVTAQSKITTLNRELELAQATIRALSQAVVQATNH